jgi:hypothetical protein
MTCAMKPVFQHLIHYRASLSTVAELVER